VKKVDVIQTMEPAKRPAFRVKAPDLDFYGKDASKATSGREMRFRTKNGNWSQVSPEEVEAARPLKQSKPKAGRRKRRRGVKADGVEREAG